MEPATQSLWNLVSVLAYESNVMIQFAKKNVSLYFKCVLKSLLNIKYILHNTYKYGEKLWTFDCVAKRRKNIEAKKLV